MPKPGYTQSPEHKKKRLEQIEGDGNGSYKDGRRSYRRKAGAKNNDGTVVHHKNGDRTNNCASNLERLTDGDRKPGRRTTSAHEKHHGGRHGDSIAIRLAIRNDRKTGGCGKGKVGTGTGSCKAAKLSQVTPFSHRTPQEADAARREQLLLQAAKVAVGIGVTGGLATIALKGGKHSNPYHDPPDIAPVKKVEPPASPKPVDSPVLKPPLSSRAETEESLRSLSRIAPPEKTPTPPSVSAPVDKGVTAKIEAPANDAPESVKKKWLITKLLPAEATVMERSAYVPPVNILSSHVPVGALDNPSHGTQFYGLPKKSGRRRKELAKTSYRTGQLTEGEIRTRSSK